MLSKIRPHTRPLPSFAYVTLLLFAGVAACSDSANSSASDASSSADGASTAADTGTSISDAASAAADGSMSGHDGAMANDQDAASTGNSGTLPVNLGAAASFVILAKSGISTVPTTMITGNLGVSPAAATYITGFSLTEDSTNVFAATPQVVGKVYAADYDPPTPDNLTAAVGDMELAFTDAAGRAPDVSELGAGDIGGKTLAPGVYKWTTGLMIPTDVTLAGSSTAVWIFQIAQDLTLANAKKVSLTGGALPKNVFWQVSGKVTVGTNAHLEGIVLSQTAITFGTGASARGRLLAQMSVDLDASTVVEPAQ